MIYGWGNERWSAQDDYLAACAEQALNSKGPILECGSGLTTIVVGAIAKRRGVRLWALEHSPDWAAKVQGYLDRYAIDSVVLSSRPLRDGGAFAWYDPPLDSMPDSFDLVVCDGPPGTTKGGRFGLVPIMGARLKQGTVILLDDAGREEELAIARHWQAELGASLEILGSNRPYLKMTLIAGLRHQPAA